MVDDLEISTEDSTTSDHAIVCPHIRWDKGEGAKLSRKVTAWDIDELKSEEEKEIYKWQKKCGMTRAQRDPFWMRRAAERNYREKLSGFSETS